MSHEVETMVYRATSERDVPWHGLGTKVDDFMTAQAAVEKGGLEWDVVTWPLMAVDPNTAEGVVVPNQWATVRSTDCKPLGIVGNAFTPIQNAEAAELVDAVCGTEEAKFETAGSLRGGSTVWFLAKLTDNIKVADEELFTWLWIQNYHDGSGALGLGTGNVRIVCANTLHAAQSGQQSFYKIRHTANADERVEEARKALGIVVQNRGKFADAATELATREFTMDDFVDLTGLLYPTPAEASKIAGRNAEQKRDELVAVFGGSDNIENIRFTRWGAYNAVAEWVDHKHTLTSESRSAMERRMESIMQPTGRGQKVKDKALALLAS